MRRIALVVTSSLFITAIVACDDGGLVEHESTAPIARVGGVTRNGLCPSGTDCLHNPPAAPHLSYYGGPVISNARVVQVLYGAGTYLPGITSTGVPSMATFYQQILNSAPVDWLTEYNTPSQSIGRGQFIGQRQIAPDPSRNGAVIDDLSLQAELAAQIAANHLPAPDANTIYMINFPSGKKVTLTSRGTTFTSCVDFCAYHGTLQRKGQNVYYGVLPDLTAPGCNTGCGGSTAFNNTTMVASHELIETITDPAVGLTDTVGAPLAWVDPVGDSWSEIGDICNQAPGTFAGTDGHTYTMQLEWSNFENACIAGPIQPTRGSWYPPSRSGNGLFIGTLPGGLFVVWFTYTTSGTPIWYLGQLQAQGRSFIGPLYSTTWVNGQAVTHSRGTMSFLPSSATTGTFFWTLDGAIGSYRVQYLAFGGAPTGLTGSWYNPSQSGWGQFFDQQGTTLVSYLTIYTPSGQPTWVYGAGAASGSTGDSSLVYVTGTNLCPGCTGPPSTSSVPIGSLSLAGVGANNAQLTLTLTNAPPAPPLTQWNRSALPIARLTN